MKNVLIGISEANDHLISCSKIKNALNLCVSSLGSHQNVDRCYIFRNKVKNGETKLYYVHEWCNDNVTPYINDPMLNGISYDSFPGLFETLSKGKAMYGLVRESENEVFKEIMTMQNIKSYLFIPIIYGENFWGWIGYDNCTEEKVWYDNEVLALITVAKNIGLRLDRDRKAKKLKQNFKLLEDHIIGTKQAVWEYNLKNKKTKFSYAWGSMLGYNKDEIEHSYDFWRKHVHPDDLEIVEKKFKDYINNKTDNFEGITRMIHKSEDYVHIQYSGIKTVDRKGKISKIVGTHIDLSELIKNKIELQKSEEKYRFLTENTSDMICQHTKNGDILFASNSSKEILGYDFEELQGKNPFDFIHNNKQLVDKKGTKSKISSIINKTVLTFRVRKKNGDYIWLESIIVPLTSGNGIIGYQSASRDITIRMKAQRETKAALFKEKKFNDLRSKFVSMASHQFRTPLTVIYSNAELAEVKLSQLPNEQLSKISPIFNRIKAEVNRMTELMNNIITFGKYQQNKFKINLTPINYTQFIENVIDSYFNNENDGRKVRLIVDGIEKKIITDETLMIHIVTNLISNAFKYSKNCEAPIIQLTYLEDKIKIDVIDFGIGIPKDDIKKLFDSFYRASNSITIAGSGLGLAIIKQFTNLLKGTIELESTENIKTRFTLYFPYE